MPLTEPRIDDRNYQQLLSEAIARIPAHNPEWTNFNDSDPGVTLLQLFAFMTETLLYRSNLIPRRNRIKFLNLLGVPLQPATSARGLATFLNPRGPIQTITLDKGVQVLAGQVPFETQDGIDVLPVESRVYYKARLTPAQEQEVAAIYTELYQALQQPGTQFALYETRPLEAPQSSAVFPTLDLSGGADGSTVDGVMWVALLAQKPEQVDATREAIAGKILNLGIVPELVDASRTLPAGGGSGQSALKLIYELPMVTPLSALLPDQRNAAYRPLTNVTTTGNILSEPGIVKIELPPKEQLGLWTDMEPLEEGTKDFPPSLEDTDIKDRLVTWLRVRLPEAGQASSTQSSQQIAARLSWAGVNAVRVEQYIRVASEIVGRGTGEPDQTARLVNRPVITNSVRLTINGELWYPIDDLSAAQPEVPPLTLGATGTASVVERTHVYTVDRDTGELRFGDGLRGKRPPNGAIIQASYAYGGGQAGMVGIGSINKGPELPAGVKVSNPLPTWGGANAETEEDGERRITGFLQHRDRLVTAQDFIDITRRTPGIDLGRVEVLPLMAAELPTVPMPGLVTLMVIPRGDPEQPDAPRPDRLFINTICAYLDPRRVLTTELRILGPDYQGVLVSVGLDVVPGQDFPAVREAVKGEIRRFLSPLVGGFAGAGWPLRKPVEPLELWAVATRVPGVAKVNNLLLGDATGAALPRLELEGVELPRLVSVEVQAGDPAALTELLGGTPTGGTRRLPIPTVPPGC